METDHSLFYNDVKKQIIDYSIRIDFKHYHMTKYHLSLDNSVKNHNLKDYNTTMSSLEKFEHELNIGIDDTLSLITDLKKILGKLRKDKSTIIPYIRKNNRIFHSSFGTLTGQLTNKVQGNIDRKNLTMKQKQALIHVGALTPSPDK